MSDPLTPELVPSFLARFQNFYDGVIRGIAFDLPKDSTAWTARIDVMSRDTATGRSWVICTVEVRGVKEFMTQYGRAAFLVLSDGVKIIWGEGKVFVDFATVEGEPNLDDIRSAGFYLAGT